jgi:peptidoglycan hydrolase CwlO-like protein
MNVETTKVSRFKSKKFWIKTAGVIVGISIIFNMGSGSAKVDLGKEKVSYDELVKVIKDKQGEIKTVEGKLSDIQKQYTDKQSEFDEAMKVVNNKKSVEDEIATLESTLKTKQGEIKSLDSKISSKENELASITGQIQVKKDKPKVLSAGKFTVGKDIPAGRYKAVPNRGSGNFFVNAGADVNIMLGKGDFYEPEYIFEVVDGDEIEITLSVKFIPIK